MRRRAISLFSGAGGMDLGMIQAGFEIHWANDFEPIAVETYKRNISKHIILGDIRNIKSNDIPFEKGELDLIIGGFPCQGFSIANKNRTIKDERNFLYKEMLRIIKDKYPKFFVAENVKGILNLEKGKVIKMIKDDFASLGYKVDIKLLNAADYGVPQQRERVIIIGNRLNLENPFPEITHADIYEGENNYNNPSEKYQNTNLLPYVTVEESISFLKDIPLQNNTINNFIKVDDRKIYNHIASTSVQDTFWGRKYQVNQADICDYLKYWRNKSGWSTKRVDEHFGYKHTAGHWFRKDNNSGSIPKPSDWWELKKILGFDNKYDREVTEFVEKPIKFEQSLRITNWNRASDTITATSPEIHINKERRLSARECAILQTFPDDFIFEGSLNLMYRQIGNAVPVLLAKKIGEVILQTLNLEECNNE
ncbi:DNA cytosine methyltransferase [Pasteurella atlantica]|uniref:DNA cytosine methyltransferase n=2 Tax=Pasteurellaceae TaxID=712 RepID=A0ACC6HLZ7_9PAST|nr:DNA cytosine methyltransferase [Pasteurella atlantica]MDP8051875.1 DNA cytosine methyltransferase [Pasteurella atlantica]MDP8099330.1 DNA cytosine methyltransferase [Pasteurella atlantica]MDP8105453.1 DNA cytosine methyltransferase [Pasteurella atlantica]MDP8107289.1 DNA cytosine methyltransferase [Pasteurella atlantica]MDP8116980.1 DNA cytosine methyltransferase [Pasteurella atlantica]